MAKGSGEAATWLLVPSFVVVTAVADNFSLPWYYGVAALVLVTVLVSFGAGMRKAMRRKQP